MDKLTFTSKMGELHPTLLLIDIPEEVFSYTRVTCECPIHGRFQKQVTKLLNAKQGCPICGKLRTASARKLTQEAFIQRAAVIHANKYDYSKVMYNKSSEKVTIICPIHHEFAQTPEGHLSGKGCPQCGIQRSAAKKQSDTETFIKKARQVHGDLYQYDKTDYVSAKEKLTITCPTHGDFEQLASGHLSGYGCSKCASYGKGRVSDTLPCTFYYLHISGTNLYKVGITTLSLEHRYRTKFDRDQIEVIFTLSFPTGKEAYEYEQSLLQTYSHLRYYGDKVLSTGNTELFTADIFDGTYPSELQLKA